MIVYGLSLCQAETKEFISGSPPDAPAHAAFAAVAGCPSIMPMFCLGAKKSWCTASFAQKAWGSSD